MSIDAVSALRLMRVPAFLWLENHQGQADDAFSLHECFV
jgi:hypothetical protein